MDNCMGPEFVVATGLTAWRDFALLERRYEVACDRAFAMVTLCCAMVRLQHCMVALVAVCKAGLLSIGGKCPCLHYEIVC